MQMKKPGKQLLSLILIIFLIATCLPVGIFALTLGDNNSITFSENVIYNGEPQVLAEMKGLPGDVAPDPTLIKIIYEGNLANGNPLAETIKPPVEPGTYLVTVQYEGDANYQSYSATKDIMIKPIELKLTDFITKKPATKMYDGTTNVPVEVLDGLSNTGVLEKDLGEVAFTFESCKFISKDVKPVELNKIILENVTISGDKATCYHLISNPDLPNINPILAIPNKDSVTVELSGKITPKPVGMLLNGENKVYDADPFLDGYDLSYNEDDVIKGEEIGVKTTDAFNPWYGTTTAKIKDVGQYYVWASEGFYLYGLNGTNIENYTVGEDPISSKEKYDITPISVIVEAWFQSKTEGTLDPELTYTVWRDYGSDIGNQQYNEGLLSEDVFSGALSRTPGEDIGKYDIYIGTLHNPNYIISFENGENMFAILPMAQIKTASSSSSTLESREEPSESNPLFPKLLLSGMAIIGGAFFMKMRNI
ncbi:MAG: hypothetical protein JJE18_07010 [Eubacteriaceae bacterium]|nr:hypothetical protein [Eubacteriaceae bacterium]